MVGVLVVNEQAAAWFEKADEDLAAARALIDAGQDSPALFHLQQAVEKSLKAALILRDGDYPYSHRLLVLGRDVGISAEYEDVLIDLDVAYTATRYPDTGDFEIENVEGVYDTVEEVVEWTKEQ